jgi:hypothetical protein
VPLRDGFTDDGYIHVQYATNLISRGEYSFNTGDVSYGTTSPLWVMILAAWGRPFGGGEALILLSRVLSWVSGVGAVLLMFALARGLGLRALTAWLCALALATHAWHVRWTALSMETSSSVLLIAAVGLASVGAYDSRGRAWMLGFVMALASLVRPEAYLLVPVYVLAALSTRRRTDWSCIARTLAMFAMLVVPWLVFARLHLGQFLPNTAAAKSGGLTLGPLTLFKKLEPVVKIAGSTEGLWLLAIIVSLVVLRRRSRILSTGCRFLLLWVVALPVAYIILDVQILSRYMLLTSPFAVVLGFAALEDLADRLPVTARVRRLAIAGITVWVAALNVILYFGVVVRPSRAFSYDLTHRLKELAIYVKDQSSDDAVVAAMDIGYLAFYSGRRVLDLGGLVDTVTNELRKRYTYEEVVQQGLFLELDKYPRVDFFIDRETTPNRFNDKTVNGYRFESIRVDRIDNLGIRKPGPYFYTVYRLQREHDA